MNFVDFFFSLLTYFLLALLVSIFEHWMHISYALFSFFFKEDFHLLSYISLHPSFLSYTTTRDIHSHCLDAFFDNSGQHGHLNILLISSSENYLGTNILFPNSLVNQRLILALSIRWIFRPDVFFNNIFSSFGFVDFGSLIMVTFLSNLNFIMAENYTLISC
jgi:hypothetical protein